MMAIMMIMMIYVFTVMMVTALSSEISANLRVCQFLQPRRIKDLDLMGLGTVTTVIISYNFHDDDYKS